MRYECKENDAVIELGKDKEELLISIDGETVKTIVGLKDLKKALILFGVMGSCDITDEEILKLDFYDLCGSGSVFMSDNEKIKHYKHVVNW